LRRKTGARLGRPMGRPAIELRAQHVERRDPQRRRAGRRPLARPGQSPVGPTAPTVVRVQNSALDLSRIRRFFMSRDTVIARHRPHLVEELAAGVPRGPLVAFALGGQVLLDASSGHGHPLGLGNRISADHPPPPVTIILRRCAPVTAGPAFPRVVPHEQGTTTGGGSGWRRREDWFMYGTVARLHLRPARSPRFAPSSISRPERRAYPAWWGSASTSSTGIPTSGSWWSSSATGPATRPTRTVQSRIGATVSSARCSRLIPD
jgi:hypothetical protein